MNWETRLLPITKLEENEVFVFGSNERGIHGMGAAGYAFRGSGDSSWRKDKNILLAEASPEGSPNRIGKWAIFGQSRGFQIGHSGKSYGIVTVTDFGKPRSISQREIYYQLVSMILFAQAHPALTFLVTPVGEGYAGWSTEEMDKVWTTLSERHTIQDNVRFIRSIG